MLEFICMIIMAFRGLCHVLNVTRLKNKDNPSLKEIYMLNMGQTFDIFQLCQYPQAAGYASI